MTISQYMRIHDFGHNAVTTNWDIISISPDFMRMKKSKRKTDIETAMYQELKARCACYTLRLDFFTNRHFNEVVDQSITLKHAKITPVSEYSYDSDTRLVLYISNKDFIKTAMAFTHNRNRKTKRK